MRHRDKALKYKNLVRLARQDENPQQELVILKEWVGTAKMTLTKEQQAEILFFIYTKISPDEELANFIMDTYGE